jgi:hypothetical protein
MARPNLNGKLVIFGRGSQRNQSAPDLGPIENKISGRSMDSQILNENDRSCGFATFLQQDAKMRRLQFFQRLIYNSTNLFDLVVRKRRDAARVPHSGLSIQQQFT